MHQIFTQMYLAISIGPSHIESLTELFIKNSSFDGHPIFLPLNLPTTPPPPAPQTGTCHFLGPVPLPHLPKQVHKIIKFSP